jgi:phytoene desaturase
MQGGLKTKAAVIGAGFAGLSAAASLAQRGFDVLLVDQHAQAGGRARTFSQDGFTFDMGPSWYWMPDVFESFFGRFGKAPSDFYNLVRLDPSYRVWFGQDDKIDLPSSLEQVYDLFEQMERGAAQQLKRFLAEAAYKYRLGIGDLVYKPGRSLLEFADWRVLKGVLGLHIFRSFSDYVRKYFRDPRLIQLLEFPILFLGAKPQQTPALYSLMNYADIQLGTWYPMGGMHKVVEGMARVAEAQGVEIRLGARVAAIEAAQGRARALRMADGSRIAADVVVGGADYHHIEQRLLAPAHRSYDEKYWDTRTMAPSCLLFFLGVDRRVDGLLHHNLFFDADFEQHARDIYDDPQWPAAPLFYVCCPSKTDPDVAPQGMENLFVLIPLAPGLGQDDAARREEYYELVMGRLEKLTGQSIRPHVVVKRSYAHSDFIQDYNAFKGNAYGLANTLRQTAIFKPAIQSKRLPNLYFTGQLTVPGPGVPPSLISGHVVATTIHKDFNIS